MFHLQDNNTNPRTEILAGLTTFVSMMYILVVNPVILSAAGMPQEAVLAATILASALMTLSMGLFTNLPIALAPGMGLNAFFTYTLCLGQNIPWQGALGIVFYSGVLFLILTLTGFRKKILNLIPESLRHGLTVGIGLFITLIGLKNAGLIVAHPATLITLGPLGDPQTIIILLGIGLAAFLHLKKVTASLLLSILFITLSFIMMGKVTLPSSPFSLPPSLAPTFLQLDFSYFWQHLSLCLPLTLSLFFVDLFDNMGTLLAVCSRAKLQNEKGEIKNIDRALKADAFAAMAGAILGTSSVTSYIESAAGVEQGGRTGLVSVTVAICFLLALFLAPVILSVPLSATTPALVMVGFFMISEVKNIPFAKISHALPAFITMIMIPFSFSIAHGFGMGLVCYAFFKLLSFFQNKKLTSSRLIYTPLTYDHLQDLFEMDRDPEVMKFIKRPTPTLKDAEAKLKRYYDYAQTQEGLGAFSIYSKDKKEFLGLGFLVHIELDSRNEVEVGYRLKKQHWGQGLATEIASTLLDYGFRKLKLHEVYGTTDPEHVVSQRILMKVGLKYVGETSFYQGCKLYKIDSRSFHKVGTP